MAPGFQLFSSLRFDPLLAPLAINIEVWDGARPSGSPFYMLPYHRDRLLQAAENFGWATAASRISGPNGLTHLASKLSETIDVQSSKPLRVRVLLDEDGTITVEPTPIQAFVSKDALFPGRLPPPRSEKLGDSESDPSKAREDQGVPEMDDPWVVLLDPSQTKPSPETTYKTTSRDMYNDARQRANIKTFQEKKEVLLVSNKDQEIMEGSLTTPYFWRNGTWTTPPISSGGQMGTTRRWALEQGLCIERVITADSLVDGEECWISNGVRGFNLGVVKIT
jgi:4-amino-4-deoxychorismate lyase